MNSVTVLECLFCALVWFILFDAGKKIQEQPNRPTAISRFADDEFRIKEDLARGKRGVFQAGENRRRRLGSGDGGQG